MQEVFEGWGESDFGVSSQVSSRGFFVSTINFLFGLKNRKSKKRILCDFKALDLQDWTLL